MLDGGRQRCNSDLEGSAATGLRWQRHGTGVLRSSRTEGYPLPTRPRRPGDGPPAGQHRRVAALAGAMPSPAARRLKVRVVPVLTMSRAVCFAHL